MSSPSSSSVTAASTSTAPLFKKKRSRPIPAADATTASGSSSSSSISARRNADDDEDDDNTSTIVHKSRKLDPSNALIASSGISLAKRNRLAAEKAALEAEEDAISLEDEYSSVAARVKVGENGGSKQLSGGRDDATRQVDWYDEDDNQKAASTSSATAPPTTNDDGLYRGTSSYTSHLPQSTKPTSKYTQKGPIKAPTNIRTVTVMDYQPDVCKDYKETGYCGFGDTCKFLHDRSDYLAGWQMEAAHLPNSTSRNLGAPQEDASDEEEDQVPFACLICRQAFTDPVQTRCGHYFCSACAIKRFSKTPKCFACGAQTGGIFNSATKIIQRMEKRKKGKEEERRQVRRGWGEEDEQEDEDAEGGFLDGVEIG